MNVKTALWLFGSICIAVGFGLLMDSWGWFFIGIPSSMFFWRQFLTDDDEQKQQPSPTETK